MKSQVRVKDITRKVHCKTTCNRPLVFRFGDNEFAVRTYQCYHIFLLAFHCPKTSTQKSWWPIIVTFAKSNLGLDLRLLKLHERTKKISRTPFLWSTKYYITNSGLNNSLHIFLCLKYFIGLWTAATVFIHCFVYFGHKQPRM